MTLGTPRQGFLSQASRDKGLLPAPAPRGKKEAVVTGSERFMGIGDKPISYLVRAGGSPSLTPLAVT